MGDNALSSDQVIVKLVEMGFEKSDAVEAVKAVGASCDEAVDYILKGHHKIAPVAPTSSACSTRQSKTISKRAMLSSCSSGQMRQSSLFENFLPVNCNRKRKDSMRLSISQSEAMPCPSEEHGEPFPWMVSKSKPLHETSPSSGRLEEVKMGSDSEKRVNLLIQTRFGFSFLKDFQKEALSTWQAHQDCLVLAATGSGKSLCFQIPALLIGKVVVVISPLISLMHDQCLKLSRHGLSACFLGSGQPDSTVEQKAMLGMYQIIYVCPETVLRLIKSLQRLAKTRGIALFAIDEAHCVSKWGHDFRPDYRRLSVLRENFSASNLEFLEFDIPIMALTATATVRVQEDILESLHMSKETKIVLTSFFRPNLRFSVKHSRTTSSSSYRKDFQNLIDLYGRKRKTTGKKPNVISQESEEQTDSGSSGIYETDDDEADLEKKNRSRGKEMSVEYLEDETDILQSVDDWDIACGEFCAKSPHENGEASTVSSRMHILKEVGEKFNLQQKDFEEGTTIIYVPTRKESVNIAKYLCGAGVKAAAYNASLPKSHLRQVHKEFHENKLEVVVATIAFGMGIDKQNVRRIIHYGWPQSLEAYYQEAGRAGRDGKLADCILYADLSRVPTLLPSRRGEEQTKQAYKMLSDCFRYGMNTSHCRAKTLVEYFGENFGPMKCNLCDVCLDGPPELVDVREEANLLIRVIAAYHEQNNSEYMSYEDYGFGNTRQQKVSEKPSLRFFISKIREQSQKFLAKDQLWWRGLVRLMETKGYIKEVDEKTRVQIRFPEPTDRGMKQLLSSGDQPFYVYPEADMLLSLKRRETYSRFSEWGKGWANPEIRRQRLETMKRSRKKPQRERPRKRPRQLFTNASLKLRKK